MGVWKYVGFMYLLYLLLRKKLEQGLLIYIFSYISNVSQHQGFLNCTVYKSLIFIFSQIIFEKFCTGFIAGMLIKNQIVLFSKLQFIILKKIMLFIISITCQFSLFCFYLKKKKKFSLFCNFVKLFIWRNFSTTITFQQCYITNSIIVRALSLAFPKLQPNGL